MQGKLCPCGAFRVSYHYPNSLVAQRAKRIFVSDVISYVYGEGAGEVQRSSLKQPVHGLSLVPVDAGLKLIDHLAVSPAELGVKGGYALYFLLHPGGVFSGDQPVVNGDGEPLSLQKDSGDGVRGST